MVFSSVLFLIFFLPIFLFVYYAVRLEYKNLVLVLASIVFYFFGAGLFTFILLASVYLDHKLVLHMSQRKGEERLFMFWFSMASNLLLLFYFKYLGFFTKTFFGLIDQHQEISQVILPIGISFIVLQKVAYTIDIYHNKETPFLSLTDYATYILAFPKLISGPLVNLTATKTRIRDRDKYETYDRRVIGLFRFSIGLAKKTLIANVLSDTTQQIFDSNPLSLSIGIAWLGVLLYTVYIYFDFSAYTDMAIGLGKMIGLDLPENFSHPYLATSFKDFWSRWHITFGLWVKEYLYLPLGGNKNTGLKLATLLVVIFLITGLWHGAGFNLLIWAALHAFFLILEKLFFKNFFKRLGGITSGAICFILVSLAWVFFASKDLASALNYYATMFGSGQEKAIIVLPIKTWLVMLMALLLIFLPAIFKKLRASLIDIYSQNFLSEKKLLTLSIVIFCLMTICIGFVAAKDINSFIYYQF
jgi:alginate O-acetyltransferase complex protein AlgI